MLLTAMVSSHPAADTTVIPQAIPHGFSAAFAEQGDDGAPLEQSPNRRSQQKKLMPGQLVLEVDPELISRTARWDFEPSDEGFANILERIVRPLETITQMKNGHIVTGSGAGFAVGRTLITAFHNLRSPEHEEVANHFTLFEGAPVTAKEAYPQFDLAIFDIPDAMCDGLCNQPVAFSDLNDIYPDQHVRWMQLEREGSLPMEARVLGFASLSENAVNSAGGGSKSCADNLVVLIDLPFKRGSSGGPVIDHETGDILGVIQGTLKDMQLPSGVTSPGFFKPMACVSSLFGIAE